MQYEEKLKSNLKALFDRYCGATGLAPSTVSQAAAGDHRFYAERVVGERNFTVRGYDQVVGRFVTIWPKGVRWPRGVPRAAPCGMPNHFTVGIRTKAANPIPEEGQEHGEEAQA